MLEEGEFPNDIVTRDSHGYIVDSQMLQFIKGANEVFVSDSAFEEDINETNS